MNPLRAISYKIVSVIVFTVMAAMIKLSTAEVPPGEAVFFRAFFSLPVVLLWLASTGHLHDGLRTVSKLAHAKRGIIGSAAMALSFTSYRYLPLPEATALLYAGPLMVVILSAFLLGERVRAFRITTVIVGLIGVLIVLSPTLGVTEAPDKQTMAFGAMVALVAALLAAFAQIQIRRMVSTESTSSIVFYFLSTSAILSLFTIPFGWVMPSPKMWAILICAGITGGIGQVLLTAAYRYGDASLVAPFEYTSMLFAIFFGYTLFGDLPGRETLIGAAIISLAGVAIILRERKLGLDGRKQRAAKPPEG